MLLEAVENLVLESTSENAIAIPADTVELLIN